MSEETNSSTRETRVVEVTRSRSLSAIIFDLFLLALVCTLVGISLASLGPGARLVPLIVGIPTLLGLLTLFIMDLFPALRRKKRVEVSRETAESPDDILKETDISDLILEGEGDEKAAESPEAIKRMVIFALWAVGFFILTIFTGLLISIPIALFVFFKLLNRESWIMTLSMTIGTWAFIYVLFGIVLGVRF